MDLSFYGQVFWFVYNCDQIVKEMRVFMDIMDNAALMQFIKYGLAGGVATLTHIFLFHIIGWRIFPCLQAKDHLVRFFGLDLLAIDDQRRARNSMIANILAFLAANMVAYILNILWVFERGRHHIVLEIFYFYLVSGVSALIGTMLMGVLIKRFSMLTTYAFVSNIATAILINYAARKFFIFQG